MYLCLCLADAAYVLVRLAYGSYGRIDVKNPRNSQWGTICDNGWDNDDAKVGIVGTGAARPATSL